MGNTTAQNKTEKKIKLSGTAVPQEQAGGCC